MTALSDGSQASPLSMPLPFLRDTDSEGVGGGSEAAGGLPGSRQRSGMWRRSGGPDAVLGGTSHGKETGFMGTSGSGSDGEGDPHVQPGTCCQRGM